MPATIMLWLTSTIIFAGWLTYLLQIALANAQRQVLAGVPQTKIEGVHLFPVFPILPGMVCLCLWSFQPPLSLTWLGIVSFLHLSVIFSGLPEVLRTWRWLQQQTNQSKSS
jgi:hypothetical protein